jgi:sulfur relay (sulfurtransferase) DsrC/TusE family protein
MEEISDLPAQSIEFYTHISYLFYAIAASDKNISRKEKEEIIRVVDENWNVKNTSVNSKEIIYSTLKKLISEKINSASAFDLFIKYQKSNPAQFSLAVNKVVMDSAYDIANSYAKRNKSELYYLSQLHQHLFSH